MPLIRWTSIYVTHSSQNFYLLFLLLPTRPLARLPAILQLLLVFRKHFTYHLATVSCVFIYTMVFYTYEDKCMCVWRMEVIVSITKKQANHAKSRAKPHPWRITLRHIETWEICGVNSKCNLNRRKPLFIFFPSQYSDSWTVYCGICWCEKSPTGLVWATQSGQFITTWWNSFAEYQSVRPPERSTRTPINRNTYYFYLLGFDNFMDKKVRKILWFCIQINSFCSSKSI